MAFIILRPICLFPAWILTMYKILSFDYISIRWHWYRSGFFIVNFAHVSHLFLVFLLLTLDMQMIAGMCFCPRKFNLALISSLVSCQCFFSIPPEKVRNQGGRNGILAWNGLVSIWQRLRHERVNGFELVQLQYTILLPKVIFIFNK